MVWTDYDNISLYRACIEGIEYMWVDTREQYPSKKVVKKVKKIYRDYDLDTSKIVRTCTGANFEFTFD